MFSLARLAARRPQSIQSSSRAAFRPSRLYSSVAPLPPIKDVEDAETDVDLDAYYFDAPNLMTPDTHMDMHQTINTPPSVRHPYGSKIIVRNDPSMFLAEDAIALEEDPSASDEDKKDSVSAAPLQHLPLGREEMDTLHYYPILSRRITQQTGKGKIHRQYSLVIVGDGNGLVGYGEGKDEELPRATEKAYAEAIRNMDYIERFEQRTLWTDMNTKFGATQVILRPRPLGFGLRCNPNIHQVLKAAGIKDVSAKVWGSRNPLNVIKATFRMLQPGNAPQGMGNGIGGRARRLDKGSGVRGKGDVERERGRKMVDLRTY